MKYALPLLVVFSMSVTACEPIEAPDSIEQMMNYGFVYYDHKPTYIQALSDNLLPFLEENMDEAETGWSVDGLTSQDLEAADVEGKNVTGIVGGAALATYEASVYQVIEAITYPKKFEVLEMIEEFDLVENDGNRDCFITMECLRHENRARQVTSLPLNHTATQTLTHQYRWIQYQGMDIALLRMLTPDGMTVEPESAEVYQQYSFAIFYPTETGGTQRMEAFWIDGVMLGNQIDESFVTNNTIKAMHDNAAEVDEWVAENL